MKSRYLGITMDVNWEKAREIFKVMVENKELVYKGNFWGLDVYTSNKSPRGTIEFLDDNNTRLFIIENLGS